MTPIEFGSLLFNIGIAIWIVPAIDHIRKDVKSIKDQIRRDRFVNKDSQQ